MRSRPRGMNPYTGEPGPSSDTPSVAPRVIVQEQCDEIERLRAELAEKKEALDLVLEKMTEACGMLAAKDRHIDQLEKDRDRLAADRKNLLLLQKHVSPAVECRCPEYCQYHGNKIFNEQKARIEELERSHEEARFEAEVELAEVEESVLIPNERIDKMWKDLHRGIAWVTAEADLYEDYKAMTKAYLADIGIVDDDKGGWRMKDE